MKITLLSELRDAYLPYATQWSKWLNDKNCSLNEFERYVMDVHIRNGFQIMSEELVMFYNRSEVTKCLVHKLNDELQLFTFTNLLEESPTSRYIEDG